MKSANTAAASAPGLSLPKPVSGFVNESSASPSVINPAAPAVRHLYALLVLWLTGIVLIGYYGLGQAVPSIFRGAIVVAGIVIPTLATHFYAPVRSIINRVPDATIVAFHGWRILAGFVFLYYGAQAALPAVFVHNAGWGDIMVGALVPLILLLPESRRLYIAFHWFGLADFVLAVGTGLYFTLIHHPLQNNLFTFPLVVIPWYGVGLSGASHLVTLARLLNTGAARQSGKGTFPGVAFVKGAALQSRRTI